jgi:predicted ATPase
MGEDALDMADARLHSLAHGLHERCLGNPQHLKSLLRNMQELQLIRYDFDALTWTWDAIDTTTTHSTTLGSLELWESIARTRSTDDSRTIFIASVLSSGGTFSLTLLAEVTHRPLDQVYHLIKELSESYALFHSQAAAALGLQLPPKATGSALFLASDDIWAFSHDQLQAAAANLVAISERGNLLQEVGHQLIRLSGANNSQSQFLSGVSCLNLSTEFPTKEQLDPAEQTANNIKAAAICLQSVAANKALDYLRVARSAGSTDRYTVLKLSVEAYTLLGQFQNGTAAALEALELASNQEQKLEAGMLRKSPPHPLDRCLCRLLACQRVGQPRSARSIFASVLRASLTALTSCIGPGSEISQRFCRD